LKRERDQDVIAQIFDAVPVEKPRVREIVTDKLKLKTDIRGHGFSFLAHKRAARLIDVNAFCMG
jgi:hypothetical protein